MAREVSAAKTPSGVAAPPYTITASAVHYNTLRGFPISNWILESFVKSKLSNPRCLTPHTPMALTIISTSAQEMVPASVTRS